MSKILIINNSLNPKNLEFVNPLKKKHIVHFSKITKKLLNDYNAIILSGAPLSDKKGIKDRLHHYQWLKSVNKPILGICAGHQIIGQIFGAKKIHNKELEIGYYHVYINKKDSLLKGIKSNFRAYELHTDSIKLPKDFILLGHSRVCRVEIMKHKSKPIYGIEFHPEKLNKKILKNFIKII